MRHFSRDLICPLEHGFDAPGIAACMGAGLLEANRPGGTVKRGPNARLS
jgi:hypothetical protein